MKRLALIAALLCSLTACSDAGTTQQASSVQRITCDEALDSTVFELITTMSKESCESEKDGGLEMYEYMCAEGHETFCEHLENTDCDKYQQRLENIERCNASGLDYAIRMTLIIDMESAENNVNSYADLEVFNCWTSGPIEKKSIPVKLTPQYILFDPDETGEDAAINRQTLKVSVGEEESELVCSIENVQKENQL